MSSFVTWFTSRAIECFHSFGIIEMGKRKRNRISEKQREVAGDFGT